MALIKKRRFWTAEQIEALKSHYPNETPCVLMDIIGGGFNSKDICSKAHVLGLKKSTEYSSSHGISAGGKFKEGSVSWNKGKSFPSTGRTKETQFKKGSKPANWRPIGSIRESKDGCLKIKIMDGKLNRNWEYIHVVKWEEKNGKRPRGMAVIFKDGNNRNFDEDNLECITRAELMQRNTIHNLPEELKEVINLKGQITRKINGN